MLLMLAIEMGAVKARFGRPSGIPVLGKTAEAAVMMSSSFPRSSQGGASARSSGQSGSYLTAILKYLTNYMKLKIRILQVAQFINIQFIIQ
jgi:hypothetical protein